MNRSRRTTCSRINSSPARPGWWLLGLFLLAARLLPALPAPSTDEWGRVPLPRAVEAGTGVLIGGAARIGDGAGWDLGLPEPAVEQWRPSSQKAHRGRSWRLGRDEGGYADLSLDWLETPAISIKRNSRLSFRLRYQTEAPQDTPPGSDGWDGGNLWISVDGGPWRVLTGLSHDYTCDNLYAFSHEFGLGDEVPGWSGRSDWRRVQRDLGAWAGHKLAFRFAFCSDARTPDGARLSGMQVDDILVQAGSTVQLKSDADNPSQPATLKALSGRTRAPWQIGRSPLSGEPALTWVPRPGPGSSLTSPRWELPPEHELWLEFRPGLADSCGGELRGEWKLELAVDGTPDWQPLWHGRLEAGADAPRVSLSDWAGQAVRLRWSLALSAPRRVEDDPLGLVWLEQVRISGRPLPGRDVNLRNLVPAYPRTAGLPCDVLLQVRNQGRDACPPLQLRLSLDGETALTVPSARPLAAGETHAAGTCWVPPSAGPHDLLAWLEDARDDRPGNDSLWLGPVEVLPAGQLEFGYSFQEAEAYFTGGDPLLFVDDLPGLELGDFAPRRVSIGFCDPENRADGKTIRLHILEDEGGRPGRELWSADYRLLSPGGEFLWEFEVEEELRLSGAFWVWAERRDDYPHVLGAPLLWKPGHYALRREESSDLDFSRGPQGHELLFWVAGEVLAPEVPVAARPDDFAILGAQPNPFNPNTLLSFQAPAGESVSLRVYNLTGQEVALLFEGVTGGQTQSVAFDGGRQASGVYFACLESESRVSTHKLVLSK